jgi:hypothetical protein
MTDTEPGQDATNNAEVPTPDRLTSDPTLTEPLIPVSLSIGVAGNIADQVWLTWPQLCEALRVQAGRVQASKDGLLLCFAHFANDYKATSIATSVFAVALDFDGQSDAALSASLAFAQLLSTRGAAHTTWSDGANGVDGVSRCWRIIIPLEREVPAHQWADTWRTFADAFYHHTGAVADPQCKNFNRRYYAPTTRAEAQAVPTLMGPVGVPPQLLIWGDR